MANRFVRPIKAVTLERLEARRLLAAIVITRGGTYRGTWDSQDPNHPAVVISTSEKVIIEDSTITSKSDLIASGVTHTNITVRRTTGTALNPNIAGRAPGRFLTIEEFDNVVLEGNRLNGTSGIH